MIDASTIAAIRAEYASQRTPHRTLAAKYHTSVGTVGRVLRAAVGNPTPAKLLAFPTPKARDEKPADWDSWQDALSTFRTRGYITVCHVADVHFPDHNLPALNMAYRLIARKQPDVIVVGSDTADFSVISSFDPDPATDEAIDDVLFNYRDYWRPHIDNLNQFAPNAVKVHIMGNHENRIYTHIRQQAPKLRRTVEEAWINSVRYGGAMWIGHTQEVELSYLLVQHGNRHSDHVAKALLEDQAYQVHVLAAHVHRTTSYTREGRKYPVTGATSGCLCNLVPEYVSSKGQSMRRKWNHGLAFVTVDMRSPDAFFDNYRFSSVDGKIVAMSDGQILEQAADTSSAKGTAA